MTQVARYVMNPAEDVVLFGDDLAEGMQVLREDPYARITFEHDPGRAEQFSRVTRLRLYPETLTFLGEWSDGYQKHIGPVARDRAWIVKKASIPGQED